jgi:co-chaperonin GroES (HSP10)
MEQKKLSPEEQSALDDAFPDVDPGFIPNGNRVLIQVKKPKTKSKGGIILTDEAAESQIYEEQIGRVVAIGQAAFRNPGNMEPWAEGAWFEVGDFVRFPKFGGDKTWTVTPDGEKTLFIVFREYDTIGKIYCNPLDIKGAF